MLPSSSYFELLLVLCRTIALFLVQCKMFAPIFHYNFLSLFTGDMRYPSFASFSQHLRIMSLLLRHAFVIGVTHK